MDTPRSRPTEGGRPPARDYTIDIPLNDLDAEEVVLGSLLLDMGDHDVAPEIFSILSPGDFHRDKNRWVYEACLSVQQRGEPIDLITVASELSRRPGFKGARPGLGEAGETLLETMGGRHFLGHCIAQTPTCFHAEYYAKIVAYWAEKRAQVEGKTRPAPRPRRKEYRGMSSQ